MVEQAPQYGLGHTDDGPFDETRQIITWRTTGYENPPGRIIRRIPSHCFFPITRVNRTRANTLLPCGRIEGFPSRHEFWRALWRVQP